MPPWIRHGNDAGLEIRARRRDGPMQIMSEGRNAAAPRKVIADERNTSELASLTLLPCVPWSRPPLLE